MKYLCPRDFRRGEMEEKMSLKKKRLQKNIAKLFLNGIMLKMKESLGHRY